MVKFVTLPIHEDTKAKLTQYVVGRESWSDTLDRILDCWGQCKGMVPMREADLEFLSDEHKKLGFSGVDETMQHLFTELQVLRKKHN